MDIRGTEKMGKKHFWHLCGNSWTQPCHLAMSTVSTPFLFSTPKKRSCSQEISWLLLMNQYITDLIYSD